MEYAFIDHYELTFRFTWEGMKLFRGEVITVTQTTREVNALLGE